MNLFTRKMHLFCVSNIMVSFVCTGLVGINGYANTVESTTDEAHEISLTASDTEPASHNGEGEDNLYAFITKSLEVIIGQQDVTTSQDDKGEENKYALVTEGIRALIEEQESTLADKEVKKVDNKTQKKSTSKKTSKKTTTSSSSKKGTTKSYTKPSYSSVTGDAIVSFAKQFMGLRYVRAGRSLKTGTDCSGFTMLIYREFGVSLPPTVSGQIGKGKYVAKKDLQKGDLVFYRAKGASSGASHVGIYIGGGSVIHESKPGVGVKISTVNMMQYVTARRVINSKANEIAQKKVEEQNKNTATTDNNTNTTSSTNNGTTNNNTSNENNNVVVATATPVVTATPVPTATPAPTIAPVVQATPKVETNESTSIEESN